MLGMTQLLTALIYLLFKSGLHAQVNTHQRSARVDTNWPDRWRTDEIRRMKLTRTLTGKKHISLNRWELWIGSVPECVSHTHTHTGLSLSLSLWLAQVQQFCWAQGESMEAVTGHKMLPGWRQRGTLMTATWSLPQDAASQPPGVRDESETNMGLFFVCFNHFFPLH